MDNQARARALREAPAMPTLGRLQPRLHRRPNVPGVPEDRAVVVLPGAELDDVVGRLATLNRANTALARFHRGQKARFETSAP